MRQPNPIGTSVFAGFGGMNGKSNQAEALRAAVERQDRLACLKIWRELSQARKGPVSLVYELCEACIRLGLLRQGLQVLDLESIRLAPAATSTPRGRRLLWGARFLNAMGAADFALRILSELTLDDFEGMRIGGIIYYTNYREEALDAFARAHRIRPSDEGIRTLLRYARAEMGQEKKRVDSGMTEARYDSLPVNLKIRHATGLAWDGHPGLAYPKLRALADQLAPTLSEGGSNSHGVVFSYLGYTTAKLGRMEEARAAFRIARGALTGSEVRAGLLLQCLGFEEECGLLPPADRARFHGHPGMTDPNRAKFRAFEPVEFGDHGKAEFFVDLARGEHGAMPRGSSASLRLGLPLEWKLAGMLALLGDWGLGVSLAKSILWPNEPLLFLKLDGRLKQLLHRLARTQGLQVSVRGGMIRMAPESCARIAGVAGPPAPPSFLESAGPFTWRDLADYYSLGPSQARVTIRDWLRIGWVERQGSGPRVRYVRPAG